MSGPKTLFNDGTNEVRTATIAKPPDSDRGIHTINIENTVVKKGTFFTEEEIRSLLNDGMKYRFLKNAELLKKKMVRV